MNLKSNKYLLLGNKNFLEEHLSEIYKNIPDADEHIFYADEMDDEEYFTTIFTMPLFSLDKIIIVKNIDKHKKPSELFEKSVSSEFTIVFLSESANVEKQLPKNIKDSYKITKESKKTRPNIINEIISMFSSKGFKISRSTAEEIYTLSNNDLAIVKNELEKVEIYYKYNNPESEEDILNIISSSRNESVFVFIDKYCEKNYKQAITHLNKLISAGENLDILYHMLFKRISKIYLYKINPSLVTEQTFIMNKIKSNAKIWDKRELSEVVKLFCEIDFKSKSGYKDDNRGLINLMGLIASDNIHYAQYP